MRLIGVMSMVAALAACEHDPEQVPAPRPAPHRPALPGTGSASASSSASCVPGFGYAVFGNANVTFSGNGHTDSYDDHFSPVTTNDANAGVCTNSASNNAITLSGNATVNGNACVGAGGTAGSPTISTSGNAYAQSKSVQTADTTMTPVTIPTVGTNKGNVDCKNLTNGALAPNETYGTVSCSGNNKLTVSAGTYVVTSIATSGNTSLTVTSGPVVIYVTSSLSLSGNSVSNPSMIAGNLVFMGGPAVSSISLSGNSNAAFAVYAPSAAISISGNGDIYGAVVGNTITDSGNGAIHYDTELASAAPAGFSCATPTTSTEIARATPISTTINSVASIVQGTEVIVTPAQALPQIAVDSDATKFTFPAVKGHLYATPVANISTTATGFGSASSPTFDAAAHIPTASYAGCGTAFTATCRTVFTTTTTGRWPTGGGGTGTTATYTYVQSSNRAALAAAVGSGATLASSTIDTLLFDVIAGGLGGVDHSAVAVVGPSALATSVSAASAAARPTMIYFGAQDGMLHAVCAQATSGTGCDVAGRELWAYLPRTQQPLLRLNTQSIEGSPHVADVFGDFYGTGAPTFKTVLTFHTGATAAVYALDVTDPASPRVLWEYQAPSTKREYELGQGLTLAMGNVRTASGYLHGVTFAETSNGGTGTGSDGGGGAGAVVVALDTATGTEVWQSPFGFSYSKGAHGDSPAVPATGIPGGAVGIDKRQDGTISDLVFGDLYGNVWEVDPLTGVSRYGAGVPLFTASVIERPIGAAPAVYSDGSHQFAAFATGGYVDFTDTGTSSTLWTGTTQMVFAVNVSASVGSLNELSQSTTSGVPNIAFHQNLASGQFAFAQLAVIGGQLFVTTDSSDINSTGYGLHGATGQASAITTGALGALVSVTTPASVRGGAASVAFNGTSVYASNSSAIVALVSGATSTAGAGVEPVSLAMGTRLLFLRTE